MRWFAQVMHVARKDARHSRWALGAYGATVALALLNVLRLPGPRGTFLLGETPALLLMLVVVLLGMLIAAGIVQLDSPTQPRAFWASYPFRPMAMLGAKVLLAVVIATVAIVAQLVGLLAFRTPSTTTVRILADSAWIYPLVIVASLVIAAITEDMRSYLAVLLAVPVAIVLLIAVGQVDSWPPKLLANVPRGAMLAAALVGSMSILAWVYRRRDVHRTTWPLAFSAVLLCAFALQSSPVPSPDTLVVPTPLRTATAHIDSIDVSRASEGRLAVYVAMGNLPAHTEAFIGVNSALVQLHDGSTRAMRSQNGLTLTARPRTVPAGVPSGYRLYPGDRVDPAERDTLHATIVLRSADSAALSPGEVAQVRVRLNVGLTELVSVANVPATSTLDTAVAGTRLTVHRVSHSASQTSNDDDIIEVAETGLDDEWGEGRFTWTPRG